MRSGYDNYDEIWGNEYYDDEFKEISDLVFVQKTFTRRDVLIFSDAVAPDEIPDYTQARHYRDGKVEILYEGQEFDATKFRLAKAQWDHEHCLACRFSIGDGNTFWQNASGDILCDACHDHYVLGKS